jgi:hypothetical protein
MLTPPRCPLMTTETVKFTIHFTDPELDDEDRESQAQNLLHQLKDMDDVESDRVADPNPPEGNKSVGALLVGILTAEVNADNCKKVLGFLGDRLGGKPIELEVEANGRKLKVKAHSREELDAAMKAAQEFVNVGSS